MFEREHNTGILFLFEVDIPGSHLFMTALYGFVLSWHNASSRVHSWSFTCRYYDSSTDSMQGLLTIVILGNCRLSFRRQAVLGTRSDSPISLPKLRELRPLRRGMWGRALDDRTEVNSNFLFAHFIKPFVCSRVLLIIRSLFSREGRLKFHL